MGAIQWATFVVEAQYDYDTDRQVFVLMQKIFNINAIRSKDFLW
jgi:hypothetical protein